MRFPSEQRFLKYCVSKRRTYLKQLFERRQVRAFFDLWQAELRLAQSRFEIDGLSNQQTVRVGAQLRWLLLQDLHQVVRTVVPDFPPAPPSVLAALPGALHQVRVARSMLIAGEAGVGKEQLAILLHVLAGRPGALVRLASAELGRAGSSATRQLMPERGTVFIGELEQIEESAQEELLAFLNGDARRRDLLFIFATSAEPRELIGKHGVRRDLFVRVSQTEVRLPPLRARPRDVAAFIGDVLYDLLRVPADRLPGLRGEAREISESWRSEQLDPDKEGYDYFSEALSFVMWRERKELAPVALDEPWCARLERQNYAGNFAELRDQIAHAFDRSDERGGIRAVDPYAAPHAVARGDDEPERTAPHPVPAHGEQSAVPTNLSRDQLLRQYYIALLREERGDLRRVALRAGRRLRSLHAELARLDVRAGNLDPFPPPPSES
jgi:DNA-binding NtrC family response regulator